MLNHTFVHIPNIGLATEKKFWSKGLRTMDEFIKSPPDFLSPARKKTINEHIYLSKEKMQNNEVSYFYANLPAKEQWRLFREYQHLTAYIDIETSGLGHYNDIITTIALYDGQKIKYYINGKNLDDFKHDIMQYKVIVSYNGKTFDVPFIEQYLGISLQHAHLDLRYILKGLGYSGGLKSCEHQLGLGRSGCLEDMDGFFAVLLWNDYRKKKNAKTLETLLAYNIQDVLSLEQLMIEAYNQKLCSVPLDIHPLKTKSAPANPFDPDPATISRIKKHLGDY